MGRFDLFFCFLSIGLSSLTGCATNSATTLDEGPSPEKTPNEELATFQLEPGLKIQLVAAEPMVQDPVVITFDEDGRLWVVEMRGFMPTIDGDGEDEPVGRVSVLEDTDGDGQMDVSTIYLDSMIMPRALALVPGGALVAENEALWLTQDTDGDFKADTKTLIDKEYAGSALPEHSGNGLWRSMDNGYYNAKSRFRYRLVDGEWQRDSTEFRGQWGISHDDKGRLYYNYNWSQLHADLVPPNYLSRNKNHTPTTGIDHGLTIDRRIYPIRANPAVNRGYIPGTLDEDGKLLEFTAACSPLFYRSKALPSDYYGNVFVCEPAGNLIKRNVVEENGLLLTAHDPHPGTEFLASTDERFRPVHLTTGPDGALYVADMYRGLVQHGAYVTPYLREQTLARKLVLPIHRGRIWRIVPDSWEPSKPIKLSEASSAELVTYLSHEDGWYRDMAQRLLVERKDHSVRQALTNLALAGEYSLGRVHALWTLEGLHLAQPDLLFQLLSDKNSLVSTTAIRLLEPLAKESQPVRVRLEKVLPGLWKNASVEQALQMALTAETLRPQAAHALLANIVARYDTSALMRDAVMSSLQNQEFAFLQSLWKSQQWQQQAAAKEIFLEMLTTSVVRKRDPQEMKDMLALLDVDEDSFGWRENAVLTAMTIQGAAGTTKPIRLDAAPAILTRTEGHIDAPRLNALAAQFEWPGHTVKADSLPRQNTLDEESQKQFALGRQHYLTTCAGCHGTDGAGLNRFAPPLIGSDWVLGDEKRLALIVLHGIEGAIEVQGKVYDAPDILPVMPSHSTMDDGDIAAILTYIRNAWGNQAEPISGRLVGSTRHRSQGRVVPWTADELNEHMRETNTEELGE
uniref:C-type cytochrome n=1 Tax=Roseihalotalea indica TaxID=2867963 RepID=A0AA49JEE5_9BACT|nr:c-type cytochrome [Tunicatimonas sp. TK19036]